MPFLFGQWPPLIVHPKQRECRFGGSHSGTLRGLYSWRRRGTKKYAWVASIQTKANVTSRGGEGWRTCEMQDIPGLYLLSCVVSGRKRWQCIVGSNDAPTRDSSPCDGCGAAAAACYGAWCLVMLARLRVVCDAGCRVGHYCARERKRAASVGLYSRKCDVYLRLLCCA